MSKNNLVLPVLILCVLCLLTTGLLGLTYNITAEARQEQAIIKANADRRQLFPEADSFKVIESPAYDSFPGLVDAEFALDTQGGTLGYLVQAQFRGYGGQVPVLVAFSPEGQILRLKVLSNEETPGLGKKAEKDAFLHQFVGQGYNEIFSVMPHAQDRYIIDAVSGATITSRAVTEAVNIAVSYLKQVLSEVK